jgi:TonB family protein
VGAPEFGEDYYPAQLKQEEFEGAVVVRVHIDAAGCADTLGVASSSGSAELDEAALTGAEQMSFLPAEHAGKAVESFKNFRINFKLREGD